MLKLTARLLLILFAGATISAGCNNSDKKTPEEKKEVTKKQAEDTTDAFTIKAQFIEFRLGDAEHYIFRDDKGTEWDFRGSEDSTFKFAMELPESKSNEENQGWTSNKSLQGKWFTIKYINKEQPEYQDGPIAKVPVIIKATLNE